MGGYQWFSSKIIDYAVLIGMQISFNHLQTVTKSLCSNNATKLDIRGYNDRGKFVVNLAC